VFSYFNPILRYRLERFCEDAAAAGVDGALVTDLPVEEADDYIQLMRDRDLATVFLAAPTSTDERLKSVCEASTGFVYAVSRTGVTGVRQQLATDASALVERLRQFTQLPIAVGFGVSSPQQFVEVGTFADAAVIGTAIVQLIERAGRGKAVNAVAEFVSGLRAGTSAAVRA
jgi:tryptophan synthase alpha chain